MRYFGSKTLLRNQIFEIICEYNGGIFCDPFGGIGTVGAKMKEKGFQVISGDILDFVQEKARVWSLLHERLARTRFDSGRAFGHG